MRSYETNFCSIEGIDIGDTAKPSDETCPCGRGLPMMKSLEGRAYEFFMSSDGSMICLRDFDIFFENLPVKMFQIIQRGYDELLIKIVKDDGYTEEATDFIKKNIVWSLQKPRIEVEIVDSIPSAKSGKKRYLVSKMPMYDWTGLSEV